MFVLTYIELGDQALSWTHHTLHKFSDIKLYLSIVKGCKYLASVRHWYHVYFSGLGVQETFNNHIEIKLIYIGVSYFCCQRCFCYLDCIFPFLLIPFFLPCPPLHHPLPDWGCFSLYQVLRWAVFFINTLTPWLIFLFLLVRM